MDKIDKVIIWGFKLHTHTHSYIHRCWYKTFKHLGYDTHWFFDDEYPSDFLFEKCLFITEGYVEKNIPLHKSNIYFVHMCINPQKYLSKECRLIDIRFNVDEIKDCNYWYSLKDYKNNNQIEKISDVSYYQKLHDNSGLRKSHNNPTKMEYEAFYTSWATDLLPDEFNYEDINFKRDNCIYYIGSISNANRNEITKFAQECLKNKVGFKLNDPWKNPLTFETNKEFMMKSILCPDLRGSGDIDKIRLGETGTCHKSIGYIPCRAFKSASYGCLVLTNSKHVYDLFNGNVIYSDNENELFHLGMKNKDNKELIRKQMDFVKANHTYINRVNDIITIINK